ncbi:MAG: nucleotide exchange factor GrpE [Chloroflexota bacterium]
MDGKQGKSKQPLKKYVTEKEMKAAYNSGERARNIPITEGGETAEETLREQESEELSAHDKLILDAEEMKKRIAELEGEIESLKDQYLRKVAEFENYRNRTQREKQDLLEMGNENLLRSMLDALDNMQMAIDAAKKAGESGVILDGLEMIRQRTKKIFEDNGVTEMKLAPGEAFDYNLHDAIGAAPSDAPEGSVLHVVQPGYMIKDKVLRHAKVITSAGKAE